MTFNPFAPKVALESKVEKAVREYALKRGWWCGKFVSPGQAGVPDRIFIRRRMVVFIELKRPGEKPTEKQLSKHREMQAHGALIYWCDSLESAMVILQ